MRRLLLLLLALAVSAGSFPGAANAADGAEAPPGVKPLFASREPLELTLVAPFRRIQQEATQPENQAGVLRYVDPERGASELSMKVRARGNFRRDRYTCRFPPLRLNLKKGELEGTLFAGQNKLKLVTHCSDRKKSFDQYVLQEELAYRILNLFTPVSFRTRLARIEYVDSEGRRDPMQRWGFLIEHKQDMAARNGAEIAVVEAIPRSHLKQQQAALVGLFELLIANTDWSMIAGQGTEDCCHNVLLVRMGGGGRYWPVPFDFDHGGMIAPPYAKPADEIRIRSVRQRRYRGFCDHQPEVETVLGEMRARRGEVMALVDAQPGLSEKKRSATRSYLEDFFEIISDPSNISKEIHGRCR